MSNLLDPKVLDGPWWPPHGVLQPDAHYRVVQNREAIAKRAGLGAAFMSAIWTALPAEVTEDERGWVRGIVQRQEPQHRLYGGNIAHSAARFRTLVGWLVRNFIDARMMSVEEIVSASMEGEAVEAQVLFVPDFAIKGEPKSAPIQRAVLSVVRARFNTGLPTALFTNTPDAVPETYGRSAWDEIEAITTKVRIV